VLDRVDKHPSGSALSATGHRFGTLQLRELLAARGEAGLWLARDDAGAESLVRLYPGLPTVREWHALELATSWLRYAVDARLIPIAQVALDVWPRVSFACADAEPLARALARAPMEPADAVALCADLAGALDALKRVGLPPVDVSPADVVLVGGQARLLADVGLPGGQLADACVDLDHVAPERAAAIADRSGGVRAEPAEAAHPTAESMAYALASIVCAALRGPRPAGADAAPAALPVPLEQVLRRGLASSPSERYGTPTALAAALGDAIGLPVGRRDARARRPARARAPLALPVSRRDRRARRPRRTRGTRAPRARRGTIAAWRGVGIAIPAAAVLVAAAIGLAVGLATSAPSAPAAPQLAGAGVAVQAPQGWRRAAPGTVPATLGAAALVARAPVDSSGAAATALAVTRAPAAPLLARLADAAPEPVRLGGSEAWRYRDVALDAGRVADVYLLADGEGPILAACLGPAGAPAAERAACAAALTTLRLVGGQAVPLGGEAAARSELARVMADLDRTRASERRALAAAATGRRQAAAADRLGAAYARAAEAAGRVGTVGAPGDVPRLVGRLAETGRAYAALAAAARATRRSAYAQAGSRIAAQERALEQSLAALAAASPAAGRLTRSG